MSLNQARKMIDKKVLMPLLSMLIISSCKNETPVIHHEINNDRNKIENIVTPSKSWSDQYIEIVKNNYFPAKYDSTQKSLSLGIRHRNIDKLEEDLLIENEAIKHFIPVFNQLIKEGNKIVFVCESAAFEGKIFSKDFGYSKDLLLPEVLKEIDGEWLVSGDDPRSFNMGKDYLQVLTNLLKYIGERATIPFPVKEGENYNALKVAFDTHKGAIKNATDYDRAMLFTFGKLVYLVEKDYEERLKKLNQELQSKGFFPIFINGMTHARQPKGSMVWIGDPILIDKCVHARIKFNFLTGIIEQNMDVEPPYIPDSFKPYQKYLDMYSQ